MNAFEQVLDRYLKVPPGQEQTEAPQHFEEVSRQAPAETVGDGITEALKSEKTPPFPQMMRSLFGWGSPSQRIAILKQLSGSIGPGFADSFAGGRFKDVFAQHPSAAQSPSPEQTSQINPADVEHAATEAEKRDPSIVKSMGGMLAQHPDLVKKLGAAALTIALGKMAQRMRH